MWRIRSNGMIAAAIGMLFVVVSCAGPEGRDEATTSTEAPTTSEVVGTSTTSAPVSTSSTLARLDSVTQIDAAEPAGSLSVEMANAPFRFLPEALAVPPGDAIFFLMNTAPGGEFPIHNMAIGPSLGEIMAVSSPIRPGVSASFSVSGLEEGEYVIWCTIDDHADQGMVGTLTVG